MEITIFTLFPEMFSGPLNTSILQKAQEKGLLDFKLVDFRKYSTSKHNNVDDYPFGGGAGMVLMPEPIFLAVEDTLGDPSLPWQDNINEPSGTDFYTGYG